MSLESAIYWALAGFGVVGIMVGLHYSGMWELVKEGFDQLRHWFNVALDTIPTALKLMIFLFLSIIMLSFLISNVLGFFYICDGNEIKTYTGGFISGSYYRIIDFWELYCPTNEACSNETAVNETRIEFLSNKTVLLNNEQLTDVHSGLWTVGCNDYNPSLRLFNLDFLNYQYWVVIFIIVGLFQLYLKMRN